MGSLYKFGINPFQDFLMFIIMNNKNASKEELRANIENVFVDILKTVLRNEMDIVFLNFNIVEKNDHVIVKGNNLISALWLSGIFPKDIEIILKDKLFIYENKKYCFDEKRKKLTHSIIHE